MFRHSDGNKNSWEREKANKAFLSIRHHRILSKYQKFLEDVFSVILLWSHGWGSQNSGIPPELPCLTFASSYSQICPLLRISFAPSDTLFQHFGQNLCHISKVLILPDSHFPWQQKQECCTMVPSIPTSAPTSKGQKAKKQYIATLLKLLMNGHKLFPCQILHHSLRAGGGDVTSCWIVPGRPKLETWRNKMSHHRYQNLQSRSKNENHGA